MGKTSVGSILIALLVGLGGGYILGYFIYQPQLKNLQDDLYRTRLLHEEDMIDINYELDDADSRLEAFNSTLRNTQSSLTAFQDQLSSMNTALTRLNTTISQIENRPPITYSIENLSGWMPAPAYDSGWSNWNLSSSIVINHGLNTTHLLWYAIPETSTRQGIFLNQIISTNEIEFRRVVDASYSETVRILLWRIAEP